MFEHLKSETGIRIGCFVLVLILMAVGESILPRRERASSRPLHWSTNIGLAFVNTIFLRFAAPIGAVGVALYAESVGWGLFNITATPSWLSIIVCVICLDLAVYGQHVLFHSVPMLWRLHKVHHSDEEFDVTTGLRFHTIEIVLSLGIKSVAIVLLGAPAISVLIFEVILNAMSMFNHSNIKISSKFDRWLRVLFVTPDMHRVHHSVIRQETDSNFGFNLPWWDFVFRTYRAQPLSGHENMEIGLPDCRGARTRNLFGLLLLPFLGDAKRRNRPNARNASVFQSAEPIASIEREIDARGHL